MLSFYCYMEYLYTCIYVSVDLILPHPPYKCNSSRHLVNLGWTLFDRLLCYLFSATLLTSLMDRLRSDDELHVHCVCGRDGGVTMYLWEVLTELFSSGWSAVHMCVSSLPTSVRLFTSTFSHESSHQLMCTELFQYVPASEEHILYCVHIIYLVERGSKFKK